MQASTGVSSSNVNNNQVQILEYRGAQLAAFNVDGRGLLICLPQAFELFLKHFVGGLHTVYTKLKRLDIQPVVCNVEQVRTLRGLGAIQPGVNRCKLIAPREFDILYADCTTSSARPGRPSKRAAIPIYLQDRMNLSSNAEMLLSTKLPRLELNFGHTSDSHRGWNVLQLLSLPPEAIFEWFRLSWIGEKPNSSSQTSNNQSIGLSKILEQKKMGENWNLHLNESRLNALKSGGFLNGSPVPRPEELLPNFTFPPTPSDENLFSALLSQNNWWRQSALALELLHPVANLPLVNRNEGGVMELAKPLELTTAREMASASTRTTITVSAKALRADLIANHGLRTTASSIETPPERIVSFVKSAHEN